MLELLCALALAADTDVPPPPEPGLAELAAAPLSDPWQAYADGRYDDALAAFVDRLVVRPDSPAALMNVGSSPVQAGRLRGGGAVLLVGGAAR